MDGSRHFRRKSSQNNRRKYRLWLKSKGLNEHHRKPRNQHGGRGHKDLNISKVGIKSHQCFHALFGVDVPSVVCDKVNEKFPDAREYLVSVKTEYFPIFHRYFCNQSVIESEGMSGYGVTWGHLFLHCTEKDLWSAFRSSRHQYCRLDPLGDVTDRWEYLFPQLSLAVIAYQLNRYWMPLDCVIVAIPKVHQTEVDAFLENISVKKKRR